MRFWREVVAVVALGLVAAPAAAESQKQQQQKQLSALDKAVDAIQNPEQGHAVARDAERLANAFQAAHQAEPAARALRLGGAALLMADDPAAAVPVFERSAMLCAAARDPACRGRALNNAGVSLQRIERMGEAMTRLRQASQAFAQAGETDLAATARYNMAGIQLSLGNATGALATFEEMERDYPHSKSQLGLLSDKAQALIELGRFREAIPIAQRAQLLAADPVSNTGYVDDMVLVNLMTRARATAALGDRAAALSLLGEGQQRLGDNERSRTRYALGCLQVHDYLKSLADATDCAAMIDQRSANYTEGPYAEAIEIAARSFAAAGQLQRAVRLHHVAFTSLLDKQRRALTAASAVANAEVGLDERNALLAQVAREKRVTARANASFRLAAVSLIGLVCIAGVAALAWMRSGQRRRREQAVTEDRLRVARDLHDTALQGFAAVTMQLQGAARAADRAGDPALNERLSDMAREAGASLSQVRDAVWQMRSPLAESGDFKLSIEAWLASRRSSDATITARFADLPSTMAASRIEAMMRVVQEAVANAVSHGEAGHIAISAQGSDSRLVVEVIDDGRGFEPSDAAALGGRWGLLGMRERVEGLGGNLAIASAVGKGTRVTATIPL